MPTSALYYMYKITKPKGEDVTWENLSWKNWSPGEYKCFRIIKLLKNVMLSWNFFSFDALGSCVSWKDDKGTKKRSGLLLSCHCSGPPSKKLRSFWLNKLIEMNEENWIKHGKRVWFNRISKRFRTWFWHLIVLTTDTNFIVWCWLLGYG